MRRSQLSPLPTRVTGTKSERDTPRSGPLRTISSPASGPGHVEDCLNIRFAVPCEQYRYARPADVRKSAGDARVVRTRIEMASGSPTTSLANTNQPETVLSIWA